MEGTVTVGSTQDFVSHTACTIELKFALCEFIAETFGLVLETSRWIDAYLEGTALVGS
jgi:hypothetical protein